MCRSTVDIHSATAEIRRGKKKKEERRRNHRTKIYTVMSASAMQGGHNKFTKKLNLNLNQHCTNCWWVHVPLHITQHRTILTIFPLIVYSYTGERNFIKILKARQMLQWKTVIKGALSQAVVAFITWSTAASTKGNRFPVLATRLAN